MTAAPPPPDLPAWKHAVTRRVFNITVDRQEAEGSNWTLTYLKDLASELQQEAGGGGSAPRLDPSMADRIIIARLSLDPQDTSSDDADVLTVLASLDPDETSWDWLIASWRRCQKEKVKAKKGLGDHAQEALASLEAASSLIVSYAGLVLITPEMFPGEAKSNGSKVSPLVFVPSLLNLSGAATGGAAAAEGSSAASWAILDQTEIVTFISQLVARFDSDELEQIMGPPIAEITRRIRDGLEGPDSTQQASSSNGSNSANAAAAMQAAAQAGDVRAVLAQLLAGGGPNGGAPTPPQPEMDAFGRPLRRPSSSGMHIGGFEWRSYVLPIVELIDSSKQMAAAVAHLESFNPADSTAPRLELDSVLGPIFRLNTFSDGAPALAEQYFSTPSARSKGELEANTNSIRSTLDQVHAFHFRLFQALIKASPEARERVLQYWGRVADLNRRRGAMRVRAEQVGTDGFNVNIWESLQRFAVPFMDVAYSKIDRIDPEYLRRQKRFDTSTLTRLNASEPEAKQWAEEAADVDAAPNFITEVFYLVVRMTNLGPGKAIRSYNEREEEMRRFKKRVKETEEMRASWANTPQAAQYDAFIKRANAEVDRLQAETYAAATQLLDPGFIDRLTHLIGFTMTWLVRIADPRRAHPHTMVTLPLPQEVPQHFRMLPEHIFEDVCDILLFLARHRPDCLPEAVKSDFVTFTVTFLSSGWYIKNPFIKAKLAEIMWWNVIPYGYNKTGILGDIVNLHPLALQHLVPACMSFWVEAESTGSHTQFYDKFNIRYHLSQIFKVVWSNPEHMKRIHAEAKGNSEQFVVFANRLMNDVTFLLDDALEKLQELHAKQQQMKDETTWNDRPDEERQEIESSIQSNRGHIRSMLQFGTDFLSLLISFTAQTKDAFMTPEIVSRLAAMLDYNLELLVGKKCQDLKIDEPQRVNFNPRDLLRQILSVYLNLSTREEFIEAIAQDGRSYSRATFDKSRAVAARWSLHAPTDIDALLVLANAVDEHRLRAQEEDDDLGEVPDEYTDPLMATVMRNPVRLPTSGVVVDLSTIKSHLLSDATDPFNRAPLRLDEVKVDEALKGEIEEWIRKRKEEAGRGGA